MAGNGVEVTGPGFGVKGFGATAILAMILAGVLVGAGFILRDSAQASREDHQEIIRVLDLNSCVLMLTQEERQSLRKWAKTQSDFKFYCPWIRGGGS